MSTTSAEENSSRNEKSITGPDLPPAGQIVMLTTQWCGYCRRLKNQLGSADIPVIEIDIEQQPELVDFVEHANGGNRTVPTVVFPDGSTATNPSLAEVQARLD
ncbi:mycoredoxin [Micrococcales bacterium KH10]|nr:mycoredoxin [Micrococcales bacterium KH10]